MSAVAVSISSALPAVEVLSRLQSAFPRIGYVGLPQRQGSDPIAEGAVVHDTLVRLKGPDIGPGGGLYRPVLVTSLSSTTTGSLLIGEIRQPADRYAAFWFIGVILFLLLGLVTGLVGYLNGTPVMSDQGTELFPAILIPPAIMLPIGGALHLYYSRAAVTASRELVARVCSLIEGDLNESS